MAIKPFKLTAEQKKALTDLEEDIRAISYEIARAKRAGIDVVDLEKRFEESKKLRDGILKEYA